MTFWGFWRYGLNYCFSKFMQYTHSAGIYIIFHIICKDLATGTGIECIVWMLWTDRRIDFFVLVDSILGPVGI